MRENIVTSDNFEQYLISHPFIGKPQNLYNSMNYIMQLGGKRMRPKLLLLAYQCVANELNQDAYKLALAIETFHNFSLVHDDIIDNAPIRRGKNTVHKEWSVATAILSGDNLLVKSIELIMNTSFANKDKLLNEFLMLSQQVCEGQQIDLNLPTQEIITEEEYLEMIRLKTAVLPAAALRMGAMAAGANSENGDLYYDFGLNLGMAFQLQDDYLDCFGNSSETGKLEGGDIIENKRTIMYLHALKNLNSEDKDKLQSWYDNPAHDNDMKVKSVRDLFKKAGSDNYLLKLKAEFEDCALSNLDKACHDSETKQQILSLFELLKTRTA
ncbi:MAG: polyprenyl synthetase family protein [Bacteroidia bacterium]